MKIVTYARVSSREQAEKGYSIPAQTEKLRNFAKRKDHDIVKEFTDVESAKQSGRENFGKMLKYIESHPKIKGILCHKVDRLCRNFKDFVTVNEMDVKPLFVVQDFPDNAAGKLSFAFQVLLAKHYIDNLSEEITKGMNQKAKQGTYPSYAPVGYVNSRKNGKKTIEIDPQKAEMVRKIFQWYATGHYSMAKVRDKAAEEGFRTRSGKKPSKHSIEYILKNPFYIGLFEWGGEIYEGDHPPIISTELYQQAQGALRKDNKPAQLSSRKFAYTGLMTCAHCGYSITAEKHKGKYVYYHCTDPTGECPKPYIREKDLERLMNEVVAKVKMNPNKLGWLKTVVKESHAQEREYHLKQVKALEKEQEKLKNKLDHAYEDKIDGVITEDQWKRLSKQWMEKRREIKDAIDRHMEADDEYLNKGAETLNLLQRIPGQWKKANQAGRKELLSIVVSNLEFDGEKLIPTYREPFNWFAKNLDKEHWWS